MFTNASCKHPPVWSLQDVVAGTFILPKR